MVAQVLSLFPDLSPSMVDPPPAHNRTHKTPTKKAKERYTADFEAFWGPYPRKLNCSKLMAFRAWNRLDDEEQVQAIAALPTFQRMMRGKDEQYIPHAATWLNQKRFETIAIQPTVPAAPAVVDWPRALQIFAATGRWNPDLGPEPGHPNYKGPK